MPVFGCSSRDCKRCIKPPKHCLDRVVPQLFLHKQAGDLWWKPQTDQQTLWRGYRVLELKVHQTTYQEPWTTLADTGVRYKSGPCSKRSLSLHFWSLPKGITQGTVAHEGNVGMWKRFCSQLWPKYTFFFLPSKWHICYKFSSD